METTLICHKKSIVQAYHVICQPCQKVKRVCAKCHESTEIESETPKTNAEQMKSDQEFELKIASLSERQKRSYLRKIDRGDEEAAEKILMKAELNAKNNDPFGSWGEGSDDDLDDFDDDDEDDLDV
ncbi:hypothetical protein HDV02_003464 [Globomyces sp. JEL0801]|nr:hypothetical protein HDV02_003464 [Globomyces sp. JEL0801]